MKLAFKRAYIRNKVEGHYYFKAMKNIQIGSIVLQVKIVVYYISKFAYE